MTIDAGAHQLVVLLGAGQKIGTRGGERFLQSGAGLGEFSDGVVDVFALLLQRHEALAELAQGLGALGRPPSPLS